MLDLIRIPLYLLVTLILGALVWFVVADHDIRITQAELQSTIDTAIPNLKPLQGKKLLLSYELAFDAATIELLPSNYAQVQVVLSGQVAERPLRTTVSLVGMPEYRNGKLYFEPQGDLVVNEFSLSSRGADAPDDMVSSLISGVARLSNRSEESIEASAESVVQLGIEEVVPRVLARVPIYDLDKLGTKGTIASGALRGIQVEDKALVLDVSVREALVAFNLIAALALLGLLVLLWLTLWWFWSGAAS